MTMPNELKYCTFNINEYLFGLEVAQVQEVVKGQTLTEVPLAQKSIEGLINLRGEIVTAIDMRKLLHLKQQSDLANITNIIVRHKDEWISLMVDDVDEVVDVNPDIFEPPPENIGHNLSCFLKEVGKLESQLLLVLDIKQIVNLGLKK